MGCVPSKYLQNRTDSNMLPRMHLSTQDGFYFHTEKDAYIKARALEAIKKCDILLFQQVLQQYQVRASELISTIDERKTLVHMLATFNFAAGMALVLDHLYKTAPTEMIQILNSRDAHGNTCLALCCENEAVQTLEILLKFDMIDSSIKNNKGKTAYDIALDRMSGCVKPLSLYFTSPNKSLSPQKIVSSPIVSQSTQLGSPVKGEYGAMESQETPLTYTESETNNKRDVFSIRLEQIQLDSNTRLFQLINELSQSQKKEFIDDEFPHDNLSIVPQEQFLEYFEGSVAFTWVKPEVFMNAPPENIRMFDKIDVNDVSKSPIAGCEMYSVLAAMTEFPQRLLRIFTTSEVSKEGACSVNFLVCGVPVEILLDNYFPCDMETKTLAFSTPKENELWFSYLEKAVAKLFGDYSNIDNLSLAEGFELLTSMPSSKFNLKQMTEDELWTCLSDFYQRNYMVCIGSNVFQSNARNKNFSFVNVSKVNETKIVKLRSHYGDDSWRWKHTERMKKWSKDFKEKIGFFEHEKDCFYIELKELIEQFDFLTVCYYQDTWERQRVDIRSEYKKEVFFEINVFKSTEIIISLHQKLPYFVDEGPEYGISPVEIMLAQDCGNSFNLISCGGEEAFIGRPTVHASDRVRIQLDQGKYIVRTKVYWVDGEDHDFSFSTFSSNPVEMKVVEDEENPYPDFIEKLFIGTAEKSQEKFKFSHDCYFVSAWAGPYLWVCGLNNGDKTWNLDIVFEKKNNLKIGKKYRNSGEDSIKFKIPPKGRNVSWAKRLSVGEVGLKWRFEQNWE